MPGKVLVAHYRLHPNSSDLNTASIKHQYYDPEVYDEYIREESREGGKQNSFVRMGLKTEVLYNPERDENGKAIDGKSDKGATVDTKTGSELEKKRITSTDLFSPEEIAKALAASKDEALEKQKEADKKTDKASLPIREITVNEIVFEVFQNSAKTLYTAKQKDGGSLAAEGKTLKELNENLQKVTDI